LPRRGGSPPTLAPGPRTTPPTTPGALPATSAAPTPAAPTPACVRELHDALITVLLSHSGDPETSPEALAGAEDLLRRTAARYPLVTVVDHLSAHLVPAHRGLPGALGTVLAAMTELAPTGSWSRMKACRNCHFAFYDRSRNTSGAYRSNTGSTQIGMRNYRRRQRQADASPDGE
jgi:predicted RNA-binding Zn ribbon-like protein